MDSPPQLATLTSHALDPVQLQARHGTSLATSAPETRDLRAITRIFGALDSPLRLQILELLKQRDHFVYELVNLLEASQPLISQHLRVLKLAGLVSANRQGRQVVYHLVDDDINEIVAEVAAFAQRLPS